MDKPKEYWIDDDGDNGIGVYEEPQHFKCIHVIEYQAYEQLQKRFNEAVEVLNKIKDGGVPPMVLANVTERMLAMCGLAEEFIASLDKEK